MTLPRVLRGELVRAGLLGLGLLLVLCGCGGGGSSEVSAALRRGEVDLALRLYDAQGGRDRASLEAIAAALLERDARARDPGTRDGAYAALAQAGNGARPVLERLAEDDDPLTRARALSRLAQLGDGGASEALRAFAGAQEPELQAASVLALDPDTDAAALRARLEAPVAAVRAAALQRLQRALPDPETRTALERSARTDPELGLRRAALSALAGQGAEAFEPIAMRLSDADPQVRELAATLLPQVDYERAAERLAALIATNPTQEGIAAASALMKARAEAAPPAAARGLIARAIASPDAALRGRAAVAQMALRDPQLAAAAAARAPNEPLRPVKLDLALGLPAALPARKTLLQSLLTTADMPALQAATELARTGDARALALLRKQLGSQEVTLRRAAVRALGSDLDRPYEVRGALRDPDRSVRHAAASAILQRGRS